MTLPEDQPKEPHMTPRGGTVIEFSKPESPRSLASTLSSSSTKVSFYYSQPKGFLPPQSPPSPSPSLLSTYAPPSLFPVHQQSRFPPEKKEKKLRGSAITRQDSDLVDLPLEIFALILRYCDARTVIRCSRVCCSLNSLSRDETIWRRLYFNDFLTSTNSNNSLNLGRKLHIQNINFNDDNNDETPDCDTNDGEQGSYALSRGDHSSPISWKERYVRQYLLSKYGNFFQKTSVRCDYGLSYEVVSYHYDTDCLICRSEVSKNLHVFKVEEGKEPVCIHTMGGGRNCPIFCATSNGYYVAGGSNRGFFHIWIPETATKVQSLQGHSENVISLRFSEDKLASGSNDGCVKIWSILDWSCLITLKEEHLYPVKLNSNIPGDLIICASLDFTCRVWDLKEMKSIHVVDETDDVWIAQVEVTQSCVILLYFLDKKITVWNVRTGECKILCHPRSVRCIATNDAGTLLLSGGYDGCLRFWDLTTGTCTKCVREAHGKKSIDFIRCNQGKAVTASAAGLSTDIKVWNMETGTCVQVVQSNINLELGSPNRSDVGVLSDLFFGSNSIITISNEENKMKLFLLEVPKEKKTVQEKQLKMFLRQGVEEASGLRQPTEKRKCEVGVSLPEGTGTPTGTDKRPTSVFRDVRRKLQRNGCLVS